jgi:hypothetical protein
MEVEVGAEVGGAGARQRRSGRRALIGHGGAGRQASGAEDGAGTSRRHGASGSWSGPRQALDGGIVRCSGDGDDDGGALVR